MSDTEEKTKDIEITEAENNNSEIDDIQKPKPKKPRTPKQLEALANAREKRRVKLEEKRKLKEEEQDVKEKIYREHRKQVEIKEAQKLVKKQVAPSEDSVSDASSSESSDEEQVEVVYVKPKKKRIVVEKRKKIKKKKKVVKYETDSNSSSDSDDDNDRGHRQQNNNSNYTEYPPNYHTDPLPQSALSKYQYA